MTQNLPPACSVHHSHINAFDVHRTQRGGRVKALCFGHLEMRVALTAAAAQLPRLRGGSLGLGKGRYRQPLHFHAAYGIGAAFVVAVLL